MTLYDLALSTPWAITPEMLGVILDIAQRRAVDLDSPTWQATVEALAQRVGPRLDGTRSITMRDGVAVVPILGPITRRATLFSDISGATSLDVLARDARVALDDPAVSALLLTVDSPGGEVTGVGAFAQMLYEARAAKPVWAFVEGLGASAAYWIASAASDIVADPTAALGSIGVVMAVPDPDKQQTRRLEFVSSQSPRKRPDPRSETGRADLQRIVDDTASVFLDAVARYRGIETDDLDAVADRYGNGALAVGQAAVAAGLADRLGTFEATLSALRQTVQHTRRTSYMSADTQSVSANAASPESFWIDAAVIQRERAAADELAAVKAELETIKTAQAQQQQQALDSQAQLWATSLIDQNYATPAIQDDLARLYAICAQAGEAATLDRVLTSHEPHRITEELVPAMAVPAARSDEDDPEARREEMLRLSPLGQAVLNRKNGGK